MIRTIKQVKDVRVPEQLMRAMAAEAEAARNARAKVNLFVMLLMMMFIMREARAKVTIRHLDNLPEMI